MITFNAADHTTFDTGATTLIVQAASDHMVVQSLADAVSEPDGIFRRLAQVVVENGFDVPPFVCIHRAESELHLFLVGNVTAQIAGPNGTTLDGTGTSTWTEGTVSIDAGVTIQWTAAGSPAAEASGIQSSTLPEAPAEPPAADATPTAPVAPVESPHEPNGPASPQTPKEPAAWTPPPFDPTSQPKSPGPPAGSRPHRAPTPITIPDSGTDASSEADTTSVNPREPVSSPPLPAENNAFKDGATVDPSSLDEDATLDADEVRRSIDEEPPSSPPSSSPLVTARVCPCGAPSPLGAEVCIACGSSLRREGVTIGQVPRPSIGSLVLDDGTRLRLGDSFVLGRNVPATYSVAGRTSPGISIESPTKQISKVHLEVRLVDWTVNVIDLDSANGTYIEDSEGRSPKRLRPNVVEQVSPGDTVHLGDRSFVFEAIAGL